MTRDEKAALFGFITACEKGGALYSVTALPAGYKLAAFADGKTYEDTAPTLAQAVRLVAEAMLADE